MAKVKGAAIRGVLKYVKSSGLTGGIGSVVAALPVEARTAFEAPILVSHWYPYQAFAALLEELDRRFEHEKDLFHQYGRWSARQDAGTIFRLVSVFASVERLLPMSTLFWSRHCDSGRFETTQVQKGGGVGLLRGFPEIHPLHCRLLTGWIEGMVTVVGAGEVHVQHTRCVHRGDELCEFTGTWR